MTNDNQSTLLARAAIETDTQYGAVTPALDTCNESNVPNLTVTKDEDNYVYQ